MTPRRRPFAHGVHWLAPALILLGTAVAAPGPPAPREYQLKAAFLYNFTKFIEWPARRLPDPTSPIIIGVLGRNPFDGELAKVLEGRLVSGRPLVIRIVTSPDDALAVHLLFVPAGEEPLVATRMRDLAAGAVVTVGESERFTREGGTLRFVVAADKLRFSIGELPAEATGVRISSHLLKLASPAPE